MKNQNDANNQNIQKKTLLDASQLKDQNHQLISQKSIYYFCLLVENRTEKYHTCFDQMPIRLIQQKKTSRLNSLIQAAIVQFTLQDTSNNIIVSKQHFICLYFQDNRYNYLNDFQIHIQQQNKIIFINMIIESKFHHQIQKESYVIQLNVLSETKILFYLEDAEKEGIYFDLRLKKTIRKLDIEYYPFNKFMLSQDESKLGVYNYCKRQLIIYDMETNDSKLFKRKFKLLGVYNNQIIGIFKLAAIVIQFDGTFVRQLFSTNLSKKPYLVELVGNRIFIRRKKQFYVLRLNQTNGYELKFQTEYRMNNSISIVKTGQNLFFQLTDDTKGYYLFKNCNQLKKVAWRFLYDDVLYYKILSFNNNRVIMREDGDQYIYFMQLVNFPLYEMKFKHNVQNYQIAANNQYIIKWNGNETTISSTSE